MKYRVFFGFLLSASLSIYLSSLNASTFTVTKTTGHADSTLIWALEQCQTNPGADTVNFDLSQDDPQYNSQFWTIELDGSLPTLTDDATFIDGQTQKDRISYEWDGPVIEINGLASSASHPGLQINSSYNIISHLAFVNFPATAISISGASSKYNTITGCYIGISADGSTSKENNGNGIECVNYSSHTSICYGNVISNNTRYGIQFENSSDNKILGNIVGTDASGLEARPNGAYPKKYAGVNISHISKNNQVGDGTETGRNILSGNHRTGIRFEKTGAENNILQGNYIGVGSDGITKIPNGEAGLLIGRDAKYNIVGGDTPEQANIISGNHSSGVQMARESSFNTLKGNLIGLDASGTVAVPNDHNGIYFYGNDEEGYPHDNTIGPGNIICGNGTSPYDQFWAAISIDNRGTVNNTCYGNWLGTNPYTSFNDGQPTGILVQHGAHNNILGPDNVIVNCDFNGVHILNDSTTSNKITRNLIYNYQEKPILNEDGGNNSLERPTIHTATGKRITGKSFAFAVVELYAGYTGAANEYLGSATADSTGYFQWFGAVPDALISATATDQNGNTSEFSESVPLPVEMLSFTVTQQNKETVSLIWRTTNEINNHGFRIERKHDDLQFENIGFVQVKTEGSVCEYQFDDKIQSPGNYSYRIIQIDNNGNETISGLQSIFISPEQFKLVLENYPNPFNNSTKIDYYVPGSERTKIEIFNLKGQLLKSFTNISLNKSNSLIWDGTDSEGKIVNSGQYFIILSNSQNRFVKKCLFIK